MRQLHWLYDRFLEDTTRSAMVWHDRLFSYGWLLERVECWHQRFAAENLGSNAVVALEGDYSPEVVAALLALIDTKAVVVPLTASVSAHREEFLEIAEVQFVISFLEDPEGHLVRRTDVKPVKELTRTVIARDHPGLVLFSSGSTGRSKAALHDFVPLLEKFGVRRQSLVSLTFLLLDHIGGMNTLFYVLSNCGTLVTVQTRTPDDICAAIEKYRVELLPTSPTFLNLLLLSEATSRYDLTSLKRVTYGTEVMPPATLQRIHKAIPTAELLQTYGLSEVGILRSKSRSSDSLWLKVGGEGFETKVQDGTLWIRAKSAMLGYLNAPSPFDADGWMNTGDAVEVDGDYLRILGRKSEMINVGGLKVYPAEVEDVLAQMPNVKDVAVMAESHPLTGHIVVARFNLQAEESPTDLKRRMREFCRERLATYKIPAKIEVAEREQHSGRFKKMRRKL
ncbi:MAG TPA: long-chain fatty acid--CoA ligase [Chthoniobacteraceae bacterium]|nr:long-chain fatty acid--CoA ligase [Chthoniobacteraceae bacterium]